MLNEENLDLYNQEASDVDMNLDFNSKKIKKRKSKEKSGVGVVILRVVILLALVFVATLPFTLKLFIKSNKAGDYDLNFGTVSARLDKYLTQEELIVGKNFDKSNTIVAGDTYTYTFTVKNSELTNNELTNLYALINYKIAIMYGEGETAEDITEILTMSYKSYASVEETSKPTFLDSKHNVVELNKGDKNSFVTFTGKVKIDKDLPGVFPYNDKTYYFTHEKRYINGQYITNYPKVYIALKIGVASIEKEGNFETDTNGQEVPTELTVLKLVNQKDGVLKQNTFTENASGIILEGADEYEIKDFKLYGKSTQTTYTGKNLANTKIFAGVKNSSGQELHIGSGGAHIYLPVLTGNTNGYFSTGKTLQELCTTMQAGKNYVLSARISEKVFHKYIYLAGSNTYWSYGDYLTIEQNHLNSIVVLYANNPSANDKTQVSISYFQIEEGTVATEFESYINAKPRPDPDYATSINSFGQKTVNIAPLKNDVSATFNGMTLTLEGDTFTLNGTADANFQFGLYVKNNGQLAVLDSYDIIAYEKTSSNFLKLQKGSYLQSLYYVSGSVEQQNGNSAVTCGLYTYKNGVALLDTRQYMGNQETHKSFEITQNTDAQFFVIQFVGLENKKTFNNFKFKIQIQQGAQTLEYEPYNKYKIEIERPQKNLFDIKNKKNKGSTASIVEKGDNYIIAKRDTTEYETTPGSTNWGSGWVQYDFIFKANTTYTVSYEIEYLEKLSNFNFPVKHLFNNGVYTKQFKINGLNEKHKICTTFTLDKDATILALSVNSCMAKISNLQIEKGDKATEYEPYKCESFKITLDEPLRSIGEYYDYIDLKTGKVIRNITTFTLDGSQHFEVNNTVQLDGYYTFHVANSNCGIKGDTPVLSNRFLGDINWNDASHLKREQLASATQVLTLRIASSRIAEKSTKAIQDWLKKHPVSVVAVLEKPIETEIVEVPDLLTHKGTNVFTITGGTGPAKVEISYYLAAPQAEQN